MSKEKKRILKMLADGAISTEEAEQLLDALGNSTPHISSPAPSKNAKYIYVKVTGDDTVDIRVPIGLIRAGMRLTSLIPPQAMEYINSSMREKNISFDLNNLKPNDVEELIKNLSDMAINVTTKNGDVVKIFCGE